MKTLLKITLAVIFCLSISIDSQAGNKTDKFKKKSQKRAESKKEFVKSKPKRTQTGQYNRQLRAAVELMEYYRAKVANAEQEGQESRKIIPRGRGKPSSRLEDLPYAKIYGCGLNKMVFEPYHGIKHTSYSRKENKS